MRFNQLWGDFDFDPGFIEGLTQSVNSEFEEHIKKAFTNHQSVAYETNFHSEYNLNLAKKAKKLGYSLSLYFLALKDPEIGIQRVAERVLHGGHNVSEITIRERFEMGLKLLNDKALSFYDKIMIYDSADQFKLQLVIEDKKLVYQSNQLEMKIINKLNNFKLMMS